MSRSGRAIERLATWRNGRGKEHVHAWGVECEACPAEADEWEVIQEIATILGLQPPAAASKVGQVNALLGVNLWEAPSFRADVRVDFDEHGRVLAARLLNPGPTIAASLF